MIAYQRRGATASTITGCSCFLLSAVVRVLSVLDEKMRGFGSGSSMKMIVCDVVVRGGSGDDAR